jgi:hypothetical protein
MEWKICSSSTQTWEDMTQKFSSDDGYLTL